MRPLVMLTTAITTNGIAKIDPISVVEKPREEVR